MKLPENYMERVYAGWMGKVIGIRLGAAIEGWTYEKIQRVFGELWDYPAQYKNFAADDDSNGPVFFVRALEDCKDLNKFSAQDVAEALLNYAPFEHGFFWWGGYGISTEHTAYLNLRNGIPAPRSGSIEQNGSTMAEQIGGQIFIDPWGLVSPGNPEQAAKLAEKAASVTHGGNGVWGGVYVACAISLAFVEPDLEKVLEKALDYIPADCEYARVVRAVTDYYKKHPENWRDCFQYIYENFGYDKYPGNCHIIPNAAVMILSMLYGGGDFERTLCICNMCGWDTDCNVGNVGCIMGVHCGLEGIDYDKWRKPINDFLACSSVVPSLNAMDVPYGASYFAKMAYLLAGENPPAPWDKLLNEGLETCHFEYPGSTHAIRSRGQGQCFIRNTDEQAFTGSRSLKLSVSWASPGEEYCFYKQTYYRPEDFSDSRYDPFFAPLVYPGQTVRLSVMPMPCSGMDVTAQIYAKNGATGEMIRGEKVAADGAWHQLSLTIPGGTDGYIQEVGVILLGTACGFAQGDFTAYLDDLFVEGDPDYRMDFAKLQMEYWHGLHQEVPQFARLKGHTYLEGPYLSLSCADFGEMYTGHHLWKDYALSCTLRPETGDIHLIQARVQGAMRSYAAGFYGSGKVALLKNQNGYKMMVEKEFPWETGKEYRLTLTVEGSKVKLAVNGEALLEWEDSEPLQQGGVGVAVQKGSHCLYRDWEVRSLETV